MSAVQLKCPHCSHRFGTDGPNPAQFVDCPACGKKLALRAGVPAESSSTAASEAPAEALSQVRTSESAPASQHAVSVPSVADRRQRDARRQIRSLVLMILGIIVLAATAIWLGQQ